MTLGGALAGSSTLSAGIFDRWAELDGASQWGAALLFADRLAIVLIGWCSPKRTLRRRSRRWNLAEAAASSTSGNCGLACLSCPVIPPCRQSPTLPFPIFGSPKAGLGNGEATHPRPAFPLAAAVWAWPFRPQ